MSSIPNRIRKLEERLESAAGRAASALNKTDAELMEDILESRGLAAAQEDVAAYLEHFNKTGELPEPPKE